MKHYDCFVDQEVGFKHEGFNYIGVITELNEIEIIANELLKLQIGAK